MSQCACVLSNCVAVIVMTTYVYEHVVNVFVKWECMLFSTST